MSYDLKGTIKVINDTQKISDSFSKREFVVVDSSGKYEQTIKLQFVQDNCSKLDAFNIGDSVNVSFNLNGREWTSPKDGSVNYFNSLDAWKIESIGLEPGVDGFPGKGEDDGLPDFLQD